MISGLATRSLRRAFFGPTSIVAAILLTLLTLSGCHDKDDAAMPSLQSIQISPSTPSVAAGTSLQFTATAIYSDDSHADVTAQVAWTSSNPAVATVGAATGGALGVTAGTATLTASLKGQNASTTLTVTAATLVAIEVSPASPTLAAGTSQAFRAIGTFSDNTTQDLTADMNWVSSDTAVATLSSRGLGTGVSPGRAVVTATCAIVSTCGSVSGTAALTVTNASLVSIAVTPASSALSIALGTSQQLTATGSYTDHSTQNLSAQVTWASDTASVAAIDSDGLATSGAAGTTNVTATIDGISSAPVVLTVTAAALESIQLTPAHASIALGTPQQFTATGTYTDNTSQNITNQVTWLSSNPSVATVSNASLTIGRAATAAPGVADITATLGTITSAPVALTVTAATVVSIQVTPSNPSTTLGTPVQFTATGTYTDTTTQDITGQVTWQSDNPAAAAVSNASPTNGLANTVAPGTANITAALGSVTSTPIALTVNPVPSTTLSTSVSSLALSVTGLGPSATGTPRVISITNTGAWTAAAVAYNISPALPSGTTISPASCGDIAPAGTCVLTVTPGSTPSALPGDTLPTPITMSMTGANTNALTTSISILTYGSVYQGGFVFSIDDSTPTTGGMGGKIAALADQTLNAAWSGDFSGIWGIDETSTASLPSPAANQLTGMSACNGAVDGSCNTSNTLDFYMAAGSPPSLNSYAAGICKETIGDYSDWYLPAICELSYDAASTGTGCGTSAAPTIQNMQSNLAESGIGSLTSALHWSSTEYSANPAHIAWAHLFAGANAGATEVVIAKNSSFAVRCARVISP